MMDNSYSKKKCIRCVLPERKPDIWLNDKGVCNICVEYAVNSKSNKQTKLLETDFIRTVNRYRGKQKYDCLLMCSGGKDSISALYYLKKRYSLNPLVFTFDHGFENQDALNNIENAVEILGVDSLFFKSVYMKDMFSEVIKTNSKAVICHVCSIWYMQVTLDIALRYKTPLVIAGWTKGQSSGAGHSNYIQKQPEFYSMAKATKEFINSYVFKNDKYKDFPRSMEEVLAKARKKQKYIILSPHWFLPFSSDVYTDVIKKELKWKLSSCSYPKNSTNCRLNFVSVEQSLKHYGYTHYHVEMSKLIREGMLTREEALECLKINFNNQAIEDIYKKLNTNFPKR